MMSVAKYLADGHATRQAGRGWVCGGWVGQTGDDMEVGVGLRLHVFAISIDALCFVMCSLAVVHVCACVFVPERTCPYVGACVAAYIHTCTFADLQCCYKT